MTQIKIEWLSDSSECECCGVSYADGARVFFDDVEVLPLIPSAHCYDGDHWDDREVYEKIFEKLGHTITTESGNIDDF